MVPFVGEVPIAPILWIVVAVVAIVATSNGVNLTDGLDGLSGGTMTFAWISYMVIALLNAPGQVNLAIVCALIAGALCWIPLVQCASSERDYWRRWCTRIWRCTCSDGFGDGPCAASAAHRHHLCGGNRFSNPAGGQREAQLANASSYSRRSIITLNGSAVAETQITFRFWIIGAIGGISRHRHLPGHTSARMSGDGLTLDDLNAPAIAAGSLRGREVVILGGGRTGQATALFAAGAGAHVTVHDTDSIERVVGAVEMFAGNTNSHLVWRR